MVEGELYDKATNESLGITATAELVPEAANGTVDVMFEIADVPEDIAREAMRLASNKLPIRCKIVRREGGPVQKLPGSDAGKKDAAVAEPEEVAAEVSDGGNE